MGLTWFQSLRLTRDAWRSCLVKSSNRTSLTFTPSSTRTSFKPRETDFTTEVQLTQLSRLIKHELFKKSSSSLWSFRTTTSPHFCSSPLSPKFSRKVLIQSSCSSQRCSNTSLTSTNGRRSTQITTDTSEALMEVFLTLDRSIEKCFQRRSLPNWMSKRITAQEWTAPRFTRSSTRSIFSQSAESTLTWLATGESGITKASQLDQWSKT